MLCSHLSFSDWGPPVGSLCILHYSAGKEEAGGGGLSEGLHPFTQPAGSEVLHSEDKLGPALGLPDSCLRARPGVWLGSLGSFVPDSFVPGSSTS